MAVTVASALPTWDMTVIYPSPSSPEYDSSVTQLVAALDTLESLMLDAEGQPAPSQSEVISQFEALLAAFNDTAELAHINDAFLYGFVAVNSRDTIAQARLSELELLLSRLSKLETRLTAWLGTLDIDALLAASAAARDHEFQLRHAQVDALHLMEPGQEELAAELTLSGGSAWSRLDDDLTSQITVPFTNAAGEVEELSMSELRNLAMDQDRDVRRRAYEAELAAWNLWKTPVAAALNGVKGQDTTLMMRRGWPTILDQALHTNHIDRETLDAMLAAARETFPDFRRYFKAKAKVLGVEQLAFYDLFAPIGGKGREWTWEETLEFVNTNFGSYSDRMRGLAERAIAERWVDAGPRPGKSGGAFCMGLRPGESRVLMNFTPAFDGVRTLAHELGHAYHNLCQEHISPWRRGATPMTLAETASTFCETIMTQAAIASGTEDEQFAILQDSVQSAAQIVVDISSRFLFEDAVCARRAERALSAEEFCELMLDAQRQTYGDGLDPDLLHPYMWAAKGHYYSPGGAYYNYPYMFGLLFGIGLYATYQQDPDAFRAHYDDLLESTGDGDAATLAARFGIDTRSGAFWQSSLDVIRKDIDTFVELAERRLATG